jgi:predicted translin family RNA/ssDNA-binding protein
VKADIREEDGDVFHITVENYLFGLIDATEELSRLVQNSVIIGDWWRPAQLSKLVRDVHQAFQLLNLKNDGLRRKVDGIKYSVKRVEEVMYDLKLRGLLQEKPEAGQENGEPDGKKVKQDGAVEAEMKE